MKQILIVYFVAVCDINKRDLSRKPYSIPVLRMRRIFLRLDANIIPQWILSPFCLKNSYSFVINKEQIITFGISLHQRFGDSTSAAWHIFAPRNNVPANIFQLPVNLYPRQLFRKH